MKTAAVMLAVVVVGTNVMAKKSAKPKQPAVDSYTQELQTWQARRKERLLAPDGWLALAGLYWLKEGENRFGSEEANDLVFPGKAPRTIGTLVRRGREVQVRINPGMTVTHLGRAVTSLDLLSDKTGAPTALELGTFSFFVIERGERIGIRLRDSDSDARKTFHDIPSYPIRPEYRVTARFEAYDPPRELPVPTVLGTVEPMQCPGALVFDLQGQTYRLDAVREEGEDELFVIFADQTSGKETYGPGRFVYTALPKEGTTTLDFNKAYNPPCAFTPFATCPLPPPQNKLAVRIEAGEKKYGDH
jgi:uncharacterized protein